MEKTKPLIYVRCDPFGYWVPSPHDLGTKEFQALVDIKKEFRFQSGIYCDKDSRPIQFYLFKGSDYWWLLNSTKNEQHQYTALKKGIFFTEGVLETLASLLF